MTSDQMTNLQFWLIVFLSCALFWTAVVKSIMWAVG